MSYRHYRSPNLQTQNCIIEKIGKGMRLTAHSHIVAHSHVTASHVATCHIACHRHVILANTGVTVTRPIA
jgi:hypothetical protein